MYSSKDIFLDKLRKYCAYQDRCQQEVIQKMHDLKIDYEWQDEIIVSLIQEKYVDEERFSKAIVRGKFNQKNWGRNKIKNFLIQKGINEHLINIALKEINEENYRVQLISIAKKKISESKNIESLNSKAKLISYLLQKGYESHLIYQILENKEIFKH